MKDATSFFFAECIRMFLLKNVSPPLKQEKEYAYEKPNISPMAQGIKTKTRNSKMKRKASKSPMFLKP
jgi:hypothetical protein